MSYYHLPLEYASANPSYAERKSQVPLNGTKILLGNGISGLAIKFETLGSLMTIFFPFSLFWLIIQHLLYHSLPYVSTDGLTMTTKDEAIRKYNQNDNNYPIRETSRQLKVKVTASCIQIALVVLSNIMYFCGDINPSLQLMGIEVVGIRSEKGFLN